jgi:hypothetical protein
MSGMTSPSVRLSVLAFLVSAWSPLLAQSPADSTGLPPAGFGTLHQDDISVRLAAGNVQLRVLPLDERIIRLLAPDTYASLRQLLTARTDEIQRLSVQHGARRPGLFLVTFFGLEPRAQFSPEDVTVTSQNRLFRPVAILPLSAQWSESQLRQRETANAIYLFDDGIALFEPLGVSYDGASSSQWEQTLRTLERERARVYARAGTPSPKT